MFAEQLRQFWTAALHELAEVDPQPEIEPLEGWTDGLVQAQRVILTGLGGVKFVAEYFKPAWAEAEPLPAVVSFPGYGGQGPAWPFLSYEGGFAWLMVYPRGQGPSQEFWRVPEGQTKLTTGLDRPENHYYRAAYMDCIRAVDFICSREEIDSSRVAVYGASQGGGLALAVACLDRRVSACFAHVPFLVNYRVAVETASAGPYLELVEWFKKHPDQRDQALWTLSYIDPLSMADWIRCPTAITIGRKDEVCPPATIQPVFDRIRAPKTLHVFPNLPHAHHYAVRRLVRQFFELYLAGGVE